MKLSEILKLSKELASQVTDILPPVTVLNECHNLAKETGRLSHHVIGKTEQGRPIDAFEWGEVEQSALWYGFPDPGEAVGGTTILSLLKALASGNRELASLNLRWCFVPVIDFDIQPNNGKTLKHVMSEPGARLVDMCMDNPRPETLALLEYAKEQRPIFSFPLHDEFHSGDAVPGYAVVGSQFPLSVADDIRMVWEHFNYPIEPRVNHPKFGAGFYLADEDTTSYQKTTQSVLEQFGPVLFFEVSPYPHLSAADLVAMQLAAGLRVLNEVTA